MQGQIRGFSLQRASSSLVHSVAVTPSHPRGRSQLKCVAVAYEEKTQTQFATLNTNNGNGSATDYSSDSDPSPKEMERRQKISAANKGRTPWNKGLHYSDEQRAKISRATFLAMQRPEVRAKMNEANLHRPPHTDEVKLKIKNSLKDHAARCKYIIAEQVTIITNNLAQSPNPADIEIARHKDTPKIMYKAAWNLWKREVDLYRIAERWDTVPEFQAMVRKKVSEAVAKTVKLESMKEKAARRSAAKGKVQSALKTARKLAQVKTKLAETEVAVANLQRLKQQLASDPQKYAAAVAAEEQASTLMQALRKQVGVLSEALAPLSKYLNLNLDSSYLPDGLLANGNNNNINNGNKIDYSSTTNGVKSASRV